MPGIQFTHPWLLLLLTLLAPAVLLARHSLAGLSPARARLALGLRCLVLACLVLALAGLQVVKRATATSVVYVLDRSASIPDADRRRALEFVNAAGPTMNADDTAGVVVTGQSALVEKLPVARLELPAVQSQPDPQFTDLAAGLRLAAATARTDARRRIVLFSDGNENLGNALAEAGLARAAGISIDVVPVRRASRAEVVAERLLLPGELRLGETFEPRLVVRSETATEATVTLLRDNALAGRVTTRLSPGKNVVSFGPVQLAADGYHPFSAEVEALADTDRRNNRALGFAFVQGRRRLLYVEGDAGQERWLRQALAGAGLAVQTVGPAGLPGSLAALAAYDVVILSNVSALDLTEAQMVMIRSAVRDLGIGLVMIGGDNSFGVGGYYQTPVEEALPVDMDIRKLRHLPNVGVAVVIDKSGSMAMTEGGTEKIQLANEAAIALVSLLGPADRLAVIATDSVAKPVTGPALVPVTNKQFLIDEIARIRAGGGGIYCYSGLKRAGELLRAAPTKLKHIILFADSADSEEQEGCEALLSEFARDRITVSVVGLGRESDTDVGFLRQVAKWGHGRFYLTHRASALPRIFTREALLASRSQLVERRFTPQLQTDLELLKGLTALPPLRGYVATTAKRGAEVGLIAEPRYRDPVLAAWQYGLGRSVAFTSDCKPHWAVEWMGWPGYAQFWTQTVRWAMRRARRGAFETQVVTRFQADAEEIAAYRLQRGEARVVVDAVNDRGEFLNELPLHGTAVAPDGTATPLRLRQVAPGRYEASLPATQVGVHLVNVGSAGPAGGSQTVGFALAWPPEYGDLRGNAALLTRLAADTAGQVLTRPAQVFVPRGQPARAPSDVWWPLLLTALALFPLDVAVRRVVIGPAGWLASRRARRRPEPAPAAVSRQLLDRRRALRQAAPAVAATNAPTAPAAGPAADPEVPADTSAVAARLRASRAARRAEAGASSPPASASPAAAARPPLGDSAAPVAPPERDVSATLARLKRAKERGQRPGDTP